MNHSSRLGDAFANAEPNFTSGISGQAEDRFALAPQNVGLFCAQLLAGLRFKKGLIRQIFKGEGMQESVIYQDILEEGEKKILFRQLNRRIGIVPPDARSQIEDLPSAMLEELGEAMLDFSGLADLLSWLQSHDTIS